MAKTSTLTTPFRRRKKGKTNYKKRLGLLKSSLPRYTVRKTNKHIIAQFIEFEPKGDKTTVHVNSKSLEKLGWAHGKKNIPAAYLTGLLAGTKAKQKKIAKAVLDIGFTTPKHKGWWAAALNGAKDAGIDIKAGEETAIKPETASGKHIEEYAKKAKSPQFSKTKNPEQTTKAFQETKQKILKTNQAGDQKNE